MEPIQLKSGYLLKRGRGMTYSYIRPWDRRWVTLDVETGEMVYYDDDKGAKVERGRLYLGGSEIAVLKEDDVGKPFAFEILYKEGEGPSKKKFGITLACRSMNELMSWVEAVQQAANAPPVDFSGKGEDARYSFASLCRKSDVGDEPAPAAEEPTTRRYEMDDIDEGSYQNSDRDSPQANVREDPMAAQPGPSSFADIDEDEPPGAPPIIAMGPPPPIEASAMDDIDVDTYSCPKDIDEDEDPRILQPRGNQSPSASDVDKDAPRGYMSSSNRQHSGGSDWWEPGGGDNSDSAAREFGDNLQIKIKIRRLEHCYARLSRRLQATRLTSGFSAIPDLEALSSLLAQLYRQRIDDAEIDKADWTALFAAMFAAEQSELPSPARAQLGDLNVIILAEINPGHHRIEVAVHPWDMLPDIAAALASTLNISQSMAELALNRGMGEMGAGKRFSLYPKTVELLLDELCMAERSVLIHETMMLNNANGSDLPLRMPGSQEQSGAKNQSSDSSAPYVPSFLGHVDEEFRRADEDGDGMISRAEWRKWMREKERLVRLHNNEKAYLIKETRSLRKALSPVQQQAYEALRQSESKREVVEMELAEKKQEHRKTLSELARAKIRVAQLEATVTAYEESGAQVVSTLSLKKLHDAIASEFQGISESLTDRSDAESSRPANYVDFFGGDMVENTYDNYNNSYSPGPQSWIRNYVSTDIDYAAGKTPELTMVPPSIAEVNRHKFGEGLSAKGARDLKSTLARLGRETTLQVVTGIYPSSSNAQRDDLGHWDTVVAQNTEKKRTGSPERNHVLHQALRSAQPSPTDKMSVNSKGNISVMHKIAEERERKRGMNSPHSTHSPESRHRKGLKKDYMAPTRTWSSKEKPGITSPTTAVKGASGWF